MTWTYGSEHELGDWDQEMGVPDGFGRDRKDVTIVNSNGIASDPLGKLYRYGGEILTPPTTTARGQANCLQRIIDLHRDAVVNYRSNLHVHVRVPGLINDLAELKKVQKFIHEFLPLIIDQLEPIPVPTREEYPNPVEFQGAMRRYRRRRVSHHTFLPADRVEKQLKAKTTTEFFELECPKSKTGQVLWHAQPRCCVNLRQLLQTDTVEFRHFPGTLAPRELETAVDWCQDFMWAALNDCDGLEIPKGLPKFQPYVHWMEERFLRTVRGKNSPEQIEIEIEDILSEDSRRVSREHKPLPGV